jgi:Uma2 family endonuclease
MATISSTSNSGAAGFVAGPRLFTVADLAALPRELPTGPVDYELDNGRLVPMSPTGRRHGEIHSALAAQLYLQGQLRGFGRSFIETGIVLWRNPDRMVGPDASFVTSKSLPVRDSPEGYLETIPELVVEVRSKNDSESEIERKVADYLKAGVKCIWSVDPSSECVIEYRSGVETKRYDKLDTLECDDLIPGFQFAVAILFE